MSKLLQRLLGFLFPGVDDDGVADPGGDPGSAGADDDGTSGGDSVTGAGAADAPDDDFDFDFVEPAAPTRRSTSDADRLAALEAEVERRGRLADTARTPAPAAPDRDFEAEEARLRDPHLDPTERWQIESNRILRQSQQAAQAALFQAQDVRDQTLFESKIASDPHRARYAGFRLELLIRQPLSSTRGPNRAQIVDARRAKVDAFLVYAPGVRGRDYGVLRCIRVGARYPVHRHRAFHEYEDVCRARPVGIRVAIKQHATVVPPSSQLPIARTIPPRPYADGEIGDRCALEEHRLDRGVSTVHQHMSESCEGLPDRGSGVGRGIELHSGLLLAPDCLRRRTGRFGCFAWTQYRANLAA